MQRSSLYIEHQGPTTNPALVLVHGAPDRSSGFRGVLPYLASRHVVIYDRRGYGRSPAARGPYSQTADLAAVITNGKNKMPAYGKQLKPAEIAELVVYSRALGKK